MAIAGSERYRAGTVPNLKRTRGTQQARLTCKPIKIACETGSCATIPEPAECYFAGKYRAPNRQLLTPSFAARYLAERKLAFCRVPFRKVPFRRVRSCQVQVRNGTVWSKATLRVSHYKRGYIYIYTYTHIYIYSRSGAWPLCESATTRGGYIYIYIYIHMYIYIYICYMHTYTYTHASTHWDFNVF